MSVLDRDTVPRPVGSSVVANLGAGLRYVAHRGTGFALRKAWSALRLLCSLRAHARVLELLSHPQFHGLTRSHPRLPFKYFGAYVALELPVRVRRDILVTHYDCLRRRFKPGFLDAILRQPSSLWQATLEGRHFEVLLDVPELDCEGDLRLLFTMDGGEIYRLVFVFGPGRCFGAGEGTILIVSNIQGVQDFERVRAATKACLDIQPAHLLMAALAGVAQAAGISRLVGFPASRLLSRGREVYFAYDQFFAGYGGHELQGRGIHLVGLPYREKPVSEIKTNHRHRALCKREFRAAVRAQVVRAMEPHLN